MAILPGDWVSIHPRKKLIGRRARRCAEFCSGTLLCFTDHGSDLFHVSWLAAFASIRNGRKVRAVRFQHEFSQWRGGDGVSDVLTVLKGDDAREADD